MHAPRGARLSGSAHSSECSENYGRWGNESADLFDAVFKGTVRHLTLIVIIFTHKGEGTLKLYGFLLCGNTPDNREQGVQVLKPGVVVSLSRRLPPPVSPTPKFMTSSAKRESPWKSW